MFEFIIPGEPGAKGRPRFSRRGGYVSAYTPKKTVEYENLVKLSFMQHVGTPALLHGPLDVEIMAYFTPPKNTSKKKLAMMLDDKILPQKKPDSDNIAKVVLDALNKVAFDDDKQVVELKVEKHYATNPYVAVKISEINFEQ